MVVVDEDTDAKPPALDAAGVGVNDSRSRPACGTDEDEAAPARYYDCEGEGDPPERGSLGLDEASLWVLGEDAEKAAPPRDADSAGEEGAPVPPDVRAFPLEFAVDPPLEPRRKRPAEERKVSHAAIV